MNINFASIVPPVYADPSNKSETEIEKQKTHQDTFPFFPSQTHEDQLFRFLIQKGFINEMGTLKNEDFFSFPSLGLNEVISIQSILGKNILVEGSKQFENYDEKIELNTQHFLDFLLSELVNSNIQVEKVEIIGGMVPFFLCDYFNKIVSGKFEAIKIQFPNFPAARKNLNISKPLDIDFRISITRPLNPCLQDNFSIIENLIIQYLETKLKKENFPTEGFLFYLSKNNLQRLHYKIYSSFIKQFMLKKRKKILEPDTEMFIFSIGNRFQSIDIVFTQKIERTHHFRSSALRINYHKKISLMHDPYCAPSQVLLDLVLNNLYVSDVETSYNVCLPFISKISHGKRSLQKNITSALCSQYLKEMGSKVFLDYSKEQIKKIFDSHHFPHINEARNLVLNFNLAFFPYIENEILKDLWIWGRTLIDDNKEFYFFKVLDHFILDENIPFVTVLHYLQLTAFLAVTFSSKEIPEKELFIEIVVHNGNPCWKFKFYNTSLVFYIDINLEQALKIFNISTNLDNLINLVVPDVLKPTSFFTKSFPLNINFLSLEEFQDHLEKNKKSEFAHLFKLFLLIHNFNEKKLLNFFSQSGELNEKFYLALGFLLDPKCEYKFLELFEQTKTKPLSPSQLILHLSKRFIKNPFQNKDTYKNTFCLLLYLQERLDMPLDHFTENEAKEYVKIAQKVGGRVCYRYILFLKKKNYLIEELYIKMLIGLFNTENDSAQNLSLLYSLFDEVHTFFSNKKLKKEDLFSIENGLIFFINKAKKFCHPGKILSFLSIIPEIQLSSIWHASFQTALKEKTLSIDEIFKFWNQMQNSVEICLDTQISIACLQYEKKEYEECIKSIFIILEEGKEKNAPYKDTVFLLIKSLCKEESINIFLPSLKLLLSQHLERAILAIYAPNELFEFFHFYFIKNLKKNLFSYDWKALLSFLPAYFEFFMKSPGLPKEIIEEVILNIQGISIETTYKENEDKTFLAHELNKILPFLLTYLYEEKNSLQIFQLAHSFSPLLGINLPKNTLNIIERAFFENKIERLESIKELEKILCLLIRNLNNESKNKCLQYFIQKCMELCEELAWKWLDIWSKSPISELFYKTCYECLLRSNEFQKRYVEVLIPILRQQSFNKNPFFSHTSLQFLIKIEQLYPEKNKILFFLKQHHDIFHIFTEKILSLWKKTVQNILQNPLCKDYEKNLLLSIEVYTKYNLDDWEFFNLTIKQIQYTKNSFVIENTCLYFLNEYKKRAIHTVLNDHWTGGWMLCMSKYLSLPFQAVEKINQLCLLSKIDIKKNISKHRPPHRYELVLYKEVRASIAFLLMGLNTFKRRFSPEQNHTLFLQLQELFFKQTDTKFFSEAIACIALEPGLDFLSTLILQEYNYEKIKFIINCYKKILIKIELGKDPLKLENDIIRDTQSGSEYYAAIEEVKQNYMQEKIFIFLTLCFSKLQNAPELFEELLKISNILMSINFNSGYLIIITNFCNIIQNHSGAYEQVLLWINHLLASIEAKGIIILDHEKKGYYKNLKNLIKFILSDKYPNYLNNEFRHLEIHDFIKRWEAIYPILSNKNIEKILDLDCLGKIIDIIQAKLISIIVSSKSNFLFSYNFNIYTKILYGIPDNKINGINIATIFSCTLVKSMHFAFKNLLEYTFKNPEEMKENFIAIQSLYFKYIFIYSTSVHYVKSQQFSFVNLLNYLNNLFLEHFDLALLNIDEIKNQLLILIETFTNNTPNLQKPFFALQALKNEPEVSCLRKKIQLLFEIFQKKCKEKKVCEFFCEELSHYKQNLSK